MKRYDFYTYKILLMIANRGRRSPLRNTAKNRALALVMTLWIVIVLGLIATTLAFDVQIGSKLTLLQREQFVAYNLAKSGVAVGMTHLQNDMAIDFQENPNQMFDSLSDVWSQPDGGRSRRGEEDGTPIAKDHPDWKYELKITDEESKIPLNSANVKVMRAMMEYYGFEQPDSEDIAAAIVDYRDPDDMAGNAPGEKENEHYSAELGQRVRPDMTVDQLIYRCPNEDFLSIDQLTDVYGLSQFPDLFYGFDPEAKKEEQLKLRDAAAEGRQTRTATARPRSRRRGAKDPLYIKDIVTVSPRGNGRVNLNTASLEVLTILFHAATNFTSLENAKATAQSVIDFRGDEKLARGGRVDPDNAFRSLADLQKVPGIDMQAINQLGSLGVQPVFRSETFNVQATGRTKRASVTLTAIVERKMDIYNPDDARLVSNKDKSLSKEDREKNRQARQASRQERGSGRGGNRNATDSYIRIPAIRVIQWLE